MTRIAQLAQSVAAIDSVLSAAKPKGGQQPVAQLGLQSALTRHQGRQPTPVIARPLVITLLQQRHDQNKDPTARATRIERRFRKGTPVPDAKICVHADQYADAYWIIA